MPPGLGFFGSEGRSEAINFAQRFGGRLVIELARLSEKRLVFEIFHFEQSRGAFARRRRQYRRIAECESIVVEKVANGFDNFVADFQNRSLAHRTDPKMAVVHEEFDAVFFRSDRERFVFRNFLINLQARHIELESSWSTRVRADLSGQFNGGFVREAVTVGEDFRGNSVLGNHPLNVARAVPQNKELDFSAGAFVVYPSTEGHFLAHVLSDILDVRVLHYSSIGSG